MTSGTGGDAEPAEPSLDELARLAARGDTPAMERLLTAVQPRVMRLCARMLPCREDAEEASQDALLAISAKLGSFRGEARFSTWAHAVAGNAARQTYRSLRRRSAEQPSDELPGAPDPRTTSVIAGSRIDLLEALEVLERTHPEWVEPIVLRDLAGLDYAQIAEQLGQPLGTVKSRIHDARRVLRPLLRISG